MKLTDGKRTVEIIMMEWSGKRWNPDWSMDFFTAGKLPYNEETDISIVEDVYYCIEQAMDWKYNRGDCTDEAEVDPEDRLVIIREYSKPLQYTYCDDIDDKGCTEQHKLYRGIPELNGGWLLQTRGDPLTLEMLESVEDETTIDKINQTYEVEKTVKRPVKPDVSVDTTTEIGKYTVNEDVDTRDQSKIWVVKIAETLDKEAFNVLRGKMKELGGYYSRFKKGFLFRDDPAEELNNVFA